MSDQQTFQKLRKLAKVWTVLLRFEQEMEVNGHSRALAEVTNCKEVVEVLKQEMNFKTKFC